MAFDAWACAALRAGGPAALCHGERNSWQGGLWGVFLGLLSGISAGSWRPPFCMVGSYSSQCERSLRAARPSVCDSSNTKSLTCCLLLLLLRPILAACSPRVMRPSAPSVAVHPASPSSCHRGWLPSSATHWSSLRRSAAAWQHSWHTPGSWSMQGEACMPMCSLV